MSPFLLPKCPVDLTWASGKACLTASSTYCNPLPPVTSLLTESCWQWSRGWVTPSEQAHHHPPRADRGQLPLVCLHSAEFFFLFPLSLSFFLSPAVQTIKRWLWALTPLLSSLFYFYSRGSMLFLRLLFFISSSPPLTVFSATYWKSAQLTPGLEVRGKHVRYGTPCVHVCLYGV